MTCARPGLHGLIQHSLALQESPFARPFRGGTVAERVEERFSPRSAEPSGFSLEAVSDPVNFESDRDAFAHSPLAAEGMTTVGARGMKRLKYDGLSVAEPLPPALRWAGEDPRPRECSYDAPWFIFSDKFDGEDRPTENDFLVRSPPELVHADAEAISETLLELVAHKRSRLFGFALANRFVNVMLPHATLRATESDRDRLWFVQPLVSFIRGGRARRRLRTTYALTFLLLPVEDPCGELAARTMESDEIEEMVSPGWGYAASPVSVPLFALGGPLLSYLTTLGKFDLGKLPPVTHGTATPCDVLTLRQMVEKMTFGVGLAVAQGSSGSLGLRAKQFIGNDVLVALGGARVSSVTVVDSTSTDEIRREITDLRPFPEGLHGLTKAIAEPLRTPPAGEVNARKNRLDRPFFDDGIYAAAVIPAKRCLVVVSSAEAQHGRTESALMQAGSVAYMTLGAAMAIGALRQIDRRLEHLEGADDPLRIAEIDAEVAADLGEIYDLDVTRESYREMYRRLRIRLGIVRDYKTLQDRMETLYRATSTFHEDKEERMLVVLTAAIVILSVFILIGTAVIAGKGG